LLNKKLLFSCLYFLFDDVLSVVYECFIRYL